MDSLLRNLYHQFCSSYLWLCLKIILGDAETLGATWLVPAGVGGGMAGVQTGGHTRKLKVVWSPETFPESSPSNPCDKFLDLTGVIDPKAKLVFTKLLDSD